MCSNFDFALQKSPLGNVNKKSRQLRIRVWFEISKFSVAHCRLVVNSVLLTCPAHQGYADRKFLLFSGDLGWVGNLSN